MNKIKPKEDQFHNSTKFGRWIAGKFLNHDNSDIVTFDQSSIIDSLGKHMDQIQQTIRWILAITLILTGSTIASTTNVKLLGLEIPREYVYYFASAYFVFVNMSLFVWFIRIGKLIQHLDEDNFRKGLSKLSTRTLIPNPFVIVGSKSYREGGRNLLGVLWFTLCISFMVIADYTHISGLRKWIPFGIYIIVFFLCILIFLEIRDIIFSRLDEENKNQSNSDNT